MLSLQLVVEGVVVEQEQARIWMTMVSDALTGSSRLQTVLRSFPSCCPSLSQSAPVTASSG